MKFVAYQDNVLIRLYPLGHGQDAGVVTVVRKERRTREARFGRVLASGKGHYRTRRVPYRHGTLGAHTEDTTAFVPNETQAGDVVIVDALAGDDWSLNHNVPRHNIKGTDFEAMLDEPGEYRVVREDEILGVLEHEVPDG